MGAEVSLSTNSKWTLANTIISLFTAGLLLGVAWMADSIVDLKEFKAAGGRFTILDGVSLKKEILEEVRRDLPPRWLVERVDSLRQDHVAIETAIENHQHPEDHSH